MRKCLPLLLSLLLITPVQARWIHLDSAAKPGETHYFNPATLQKDGRFRRIWLLASYDEKQKGGYRAVKTLYEFDCARHKARSITMLLYPDQHATGMVIGAHHQDSQDWFSFSAHSMFRHVEETVCMD